MFDTTWNTVARIHRKVMDYLRREYFDDVVRMKVEHTEKLTHLYCEACQAWENSKGETVQTTTSDRGNSITTITSHGDPRFLAVARAALADIRNIWDAPLKREHGDELRVAGKSQKEADAELVEHVELLLEQMRN